MDGLTFDWRVLWYTKTLWYQWWWLQRSPKSPPLHHRALQLVWAISTDMLCLVFASHDADYYSQTSSVWCSLSKGHCSKSLEVCSDLFLFFSYSNLFFLGFLGFLLFLIVVAETFTFSMSCSSWVFYNSLSITRSDLKGRFLVGCPLKKIVLTYTWMLQNSKTSGFTMVVMVADDQLIKCIWLATPGCYLPS